jgi:hypothetical protein
VNVDLVLKPDAEAMATDAKAWQAIAEALEDCAIELNKRAIDPIAEAWRGTASDFAQAELAGHRSALQRAADAAEAISRALTDASNRWRVVQGKVRRVKTQAADLGLRLAPDGTVTPAAGATGTPRDVAELTAAAKAALAEAETIDGDLQRALSQHGQAGLQPPAGLSTLVKGMPGPKASASTVLAWWNSLTDAERSMLVQWRPELIGGLDGIPADARHRANLILLELQSEKLIEQKKLLEGAKPTAVQQIELSKEIAEITKKLEALDSLKNRMYASWSNGEAPLYLLGFDGSGDGRVILSVGNPDTAKHVSVYVPGTTSELWNINEDLYRTQAHHEVATAKTTESVASILWLDYDAPNWLDTPASPSYAKQGAPELRAFVDGLSVTHQGGAPHTTLIGHSYGTRVIGEAALIKPGMDADVISVAGPGFGVDMAPDKHMPPPDKLRINGDIYSMVGNLDPIKAAYTHPDNATISAGLPGVHGTGVEYLPGVKTIDIGYDGSGHSTYWQSEEFLTNVGNLVAGHDEKVKTESTIGDAMKKQGMVR